MLLFPLQALLKLWGYMKQDALKQAKKLLNLREATLFLDHTKEYAPHSKGAGANTISRGTEIIKRVGSGEL